MMMFVDTHCHIHDAEYPLEPEAVLEKARQSGVEQMICVGTSEASSESAVQFAERFSDGIYAAVGVHPHDTKDGFARVGTLLSESHERIVGVGEIGLDYFYTHSPRNVQIEALQAQIEMALRHDLPVIFHVREAFDDFWPVFDNFHGLRGELHSFTDAAENLDQALKRGLFIGVNGISTFTKNTQQQSMFGAIPLERMLLETDAPFLTPVPFRGTINEPAFVRNVAEHHARLRGCSVEEIAEITTANARALFALK